MTRNVQEVGPGLLDGCKSGGGGIYLRVAAPFHLGLVVLVGLVSMLMLSSLATGGDGPELPETLGSSFRQAVPQGLDLLTKLILASSGTGDEKAFEEAREALGALPKPSRGDRPRARQF